MKGWITFPVMQNERETIEQPVYTFPVKWNRTWQLQHSLSVSQCFLCGNVPAFWPPSIPRTEIYPFPSWHEREDGLVQNWKSSHTWKWSGWGEHTFIIWKICVSKNQALVHNLEFFGNPTSLKQWHKSLRAQNLFHDVDLSVFRTKYLVGQKGDELLFSIV